MTKSYSDRVMRFRKHVYSQRRVVTPGCLLLLLRLSDSMRPDAKVSVPRSQLAKDLDAPMSRITEWVNEAVEKRLLDRVATGRPGRTSQYQGLLPDPVEVRPGVPIRGTPQVPPTEVRPPVPLRSA